MNRAPTFRISFCVFCVAQFLRIRSGQALRLILRIRISSYFVTLVLFVVKFLLRFGCGCAALGFYWRKISRNSFWYLLYCSPSSGEIGKSFKFFACILVSMPGRDGVRPIANTSC